VRSTRLDVWQLSRIVTTSEQQQEAPLQRRAQRVRRA